jgi:NhaP-type Na+/H+ or K+/H+ antiporter
VSEPGEIAPTLIIFGSLLVLGLLADLVGRHTRLPRVTLLLLSGFAVGPSVIERLAPFTDQWFPVLPYIALATSISPRTLAEEGAP